LQLLRNENAVAGIASNNDKRREVKRKKMRELVNDLAKALGESRGSTQNDVDFLNSFKPYLNKDEYTSLLLGLTAKHTLKWLIDKRKI